jgi:hypothetical protein
MPGRALSSKNPKALKTCPYCDTSFPEEKTHCPECGASYWGGEEGRDAIPHSPPPQTEQGCLSLLLVPVLTSLAAVAVLIAVGFLINTIVMFESQQVRVLWFGGSVAVGLGIFRLILYLRQNSDTHDNTQTRTKE